MAMNANSLGTEIKAKIDLLSETEKQNDIKVWTAVAEAIVAHIKDNAEVGTIPIQTGSIVGTDSFLVPVSFSSYGATQGNQKVIT